MWKETHEEKMLNIESSNKDKNVAQRMTHRFNLYEMNKSVKSE